MQIFKELFRYLKRYISERYINNLTGDFSICFSEHLTEHPNYLLLRTTIISGQTKCLRDCSQWHKS